jgi:uracil phosphoribosyltransferase
MALLMELALAEIDSEDVVVTTPEGYKYTGTSPYTTDNVLAVVSKRDGFILAEALRRTVGAATEVVDITCDPASKAVLSSENIPRDVASRELIILLEPVMASADRCMNIVRALLQYGVTPDRILVISLTMAPQVADQLAAFQRGEIKVVSATIEAGVDSRSFLKPGLGKFHERYEAGARA